MKIKKYNHRVVNTIFLLALITLGLSACGVKPSHVDPPAGSENSPFPRTYPSPSTDP